MWVSMCFPRAVDSYFIVKKRPYSLAKIATRGVRPGYRLGEWQTFQKMGAAGAPRCVPTMEHMVGRSEENFGCRQPFLIGKWPPRRHTAFRRTAEFAA